MSGKTTLKFKKGDAVYIASPYLLNNFIKYVPVIIRYANHSSHTYIFDDIIYTGDCSADYVFATKEDAIKYITPYIKRRIKQLDIKCAKIKPKYKDTTKQRYINMLKEEELNV